MRRLRLVLCATAVISLIVVTALPALISPSSWQVRGTRTNTQLGEAVAYADVNGDGYSDVILGERHFRRPGGLEEGRVLVYHGSAAGLPATPSWSYESNLVPNHDFGHSVSSAGDVNGDGFDDVLVGARFAYSQGRAFLFLGSSLGLQSNPAWTGSVGQNYARFGESVSGAGDVNGDGYADVLVGAAQYRPPSGNEGGVFLFHGSPTGLSLIPDWSVTSDTAFSALGTAVAAAGDVNADGYGDVILGEAEFSGGLVRRGRGRVYLGSASGLSPVSVWSVEGQQTDARLGRVVAGGGDFDGDGFSDVFVAGPLHDGSLENEGIVQVYTGAANGVTAAPSFSVLGGQFNIAFGYSVGLSGDADGDGYDDLAASAPFQLDGQHMRGAARIYYGSAAGAPSRPVETILGTQDEAVFGSIVSLAGDVNADGFADLIVGAPSHDDDAAQLTDNGRVDVYLGIGSHADADGDGRSPAAGDCDDRDAGRWSRPAEAANLSFVDGETLAWDSQVGADGHQSWFDLLRSESPEDFLSAACVESNGSTDTLATDSQAPLPDEAFYYLVRAENGCRGVTGRGPLGQTSWGIQRSGRGCT